MPKYYISKWKDFGWVLGVPNDFGEPMFYCSSFEDAWSKYDRFVLELGNCEGNWDGSD